MHILRDISTQKNCWALWTILKLSIHRRRLKKLFIDRAELSHITIYLTTHDGQWNRLSNFNAACFISQRDTRLSINGSQLICHDLPWRRSKFKHPEFKPPGTFSISMEILVLRVHIAATHPPLLSISSRLKLLARGNETWSKSRRS